MAAGGILTLGLGGFAGAGRLLTLGYSAGPAAAVINGPWCVEAVGVYSAGAIARGASHAGAIARDTFIAGAVARQGSCQR